MIRPVPMPPPTAAPPFNREWTCPFDGTKFRSYPLGSPRKLDNGLDLDAYFMASTPWAIASCPTNGFVFYKYEFDDAELELLRPLVLSDAFQALREDSVYFRLALILDRAGASLETVSSALLNATRDTKGAAAYKRYAGALLEKFPALLKRGRNPDEQAELLALRTELLRRSGLFDEAGDSARELLATAEEGTFLHLIGGFQSDLIARRFDGVELIPTKFEKRAKPSSYFLSQQIPKSASGTKRLGEFELQSVGWFFCWSLDGLTLAVSNGRLHLLHSFAGKASRRIVLPLGHGPIRAALPDGRWLCTPFDPRGRPFLSNGISVHNRNLKMVLDVSLNTPFDTRPGIASVNRETSVVFANLRFDVTTGRPVPIALPGSSPTILDEDRNLDELKGVRVGTLLLGGYEWDMCSDITATIKRRRLDAKRARFFSRSDNQALRDAGARLRSQLAKSPLRPKTQYAETPLTILAGDRERPRLLLFVASGRDRGRLLLWDYELARELWSVPIDEALIRERSHKLSSMALDDKLNEAERLGSEFLPMVSFLHWSKSWSGALMASRKQAIVAVSFGYGDSAVMSFDVDNGTFLSARLGWGYRAKVSISDRDGVIAFAYGRTLSLLDPDLKEIETIRANDSRITDVAFSPDGERIAIDVDGCVSVFRMNR